MLFTRSFNERKSYCGLKFTAGLPSLLPSTYHRQLASGFYYHLLRTRDARIVKLIIREVR